ncbi:MAG: hypothetical protein ACYS6W_18115 [Planctomycetota bacterium]
MKLLKRFFELTGNIAWSLAVVFTLMTAVTWLAARDAVLFIAPIALYVLAGCAILATTVATLAFVIERSEWLATRRTEARKDRTLAKNEARMAGIASDRAQMHLMAEGRMMAAAVRQMENGLIHPSALGEGAKFSSFPAQIINKIEAQAALPEPDNSLNFKAIATKALASRGAGRFIVYGGMHGGKTTLAKHTTKYAVNEIAKRRGGRVFVIDPHAPKTIWSDDVQVIGAGKDYGAIRRFLNWVIEDIDQRYEDGCGDDSRPLPAPHKPNFIICEEWCGVVGYLMAEKQWGNQDTQAMYMDARKAGWGYMLIVQEFTVGALGLQGKGNLLNGVEYFVTLEKNAITNTYHAKIGNSFKDKTPYDLITPGPFNGPLYYSAAEAQTEQAKANKYLTFDDLSFVVAESEPSRADTIRQLHEDGLSNQQIANHFGKASCSGRFYYEVKEALKGH